MEAITMSNDKQERSRKGTSGLFFVGFLILGLAIGFIVGNVVGGFFVGLGVGFIAMAIARAITGEW
jgi:dolichol kinase